MTREPLRFDVAVIGGGLVGAAIAYGLVDRVGRLAVLDEGDVAFRASRGNFGLIWVQSKGGGLPPYGEWTLRSAQTWPRLASSLAMATGIDVRLEQQGGLSVFLSERERDLRVEQMTRMLAQPGMPQYAWKVLDAADLRNRIPGIGPRVVGALHCEHDGHVNPLKLLRALHTALRLHGAHYLPDHAALAVTPRGRDGFEIGCRGGIVHAQRIVIACGLGNATLAQQVGLRAPVRPQLGQIIVLERMPPLLAQPLTTLRQTDEGTVMIGDSQEEVGFRDSVDLHVLATLADRAVATLPALANASVVRTWGALRVMSPDGFPIYEQSERYPGAFVATCHSGVTLAAAHAFTLADAIVAGALPAELAPFSARRFDVRATA